jgi:hypothetical protein
VFFTDTGEPPKFSGFIWEIDAQNHLSCFHKVGGHWLSLDTNGNFAPTAFQKWFQQRTTPRFHKIVPSDSSPALIQTDGFPFVVNRDGNLYFVSGEAPKLAGGLQITRLTPDGNLTRLVPDLDETAKKHGGITGLACDLDGSLYVAYPKAIQRITMKGRVTTLIDQIVVKDCEKVSAAEAPEPYLRGLAVDSRGTVYAAATGCRCVVRITADGKVETVLKAERPWSPTGVAVLGEDVFVLEYTNPNAKPPEWLPRVRKLGRDGKVTTLATVSRKGSNP